MTDLVVTWTGWHADALRRALRMTNEGFAEHLGVSVRSVAYWRGHPDWVTRQGTQQILDAALDRAPDLARAQFRRQLAESGRDATDPAVRVPPGHDAPAALTDWLTSTRISDETVEAIGRDAAGLAEAHAQTPAAVLLAEVRPFQTCVQRLLMGGKIRPRQERELLRVNGEVLAHMSLLLSDLRAGQEADDYGSAAKLYLREAGACEATAWYVLAKNARWRHRYASAADLASEGLRLGAPPPMAVQLACYEANTAALAGAADRAWAAMRNAEELATALPACQVNPSPWSFPPDRMTIFRLSVALRTGQPDAALAVASGISPTWDSGGPHVPAAWAQIRIGAAIASVIKSEPDGASEHVQPVFDLPSGLRIATVTGWLAELDRRLAEPRYAGLPLAIELRQQIRGFTTAAPDSHRAQHDTHDKEVPV